MVAVRGGYFPREGSVRPCAALQALTDIRVACNRIGSYINNLHPEEHRELYGLIEQLIDAAIPLWDITLGDLNMLERFSQPPFKRIKYDDTLYDPLLEDKSQGPVRIEGETDWEFLLRREHWHESVRVLIRPEPNLPFDEQGYDEAMHDTMRGGKDGGLREIYGGQGRPLQIIVKIANIELTPEKPRYDGGTWHVEGKLVRLAPTHSQLF